MRLEDEDWALSMKLSRRSRNDVQGVENLLRSLLIHRLVPAMKMVLRRSLGGAQCSVYCEHCERWTRIDHTPSTVQCRTCERWFRVELVIYTEIDED